METYTAEQIIGIGGSEWKTPTKRRVYLNDWPEWVGLEVDHYKSGNIRSATLDGEHISNTKAGKILCGRVYWEDDRIVMQNVDDRLADRVGPAIADRVAGITSTEPTHP